MYCGPSLWEMTYLLAIHTRVMNYYSRMCASYILSMQSEWAVLICQKIYIVGIVNERKLIFLPTRSTFYFKLKKVPLTVHLNNHSKSFVHFIIVLVVIVDIEEDVAIWYKVWGFARVCISFLKRKNLWNQYQIKHYSIQPPTHFSPLNLYSYLQSKDSS